MYEVLESALIYVCMTHGTMTLLRWYEHLTETADCNDIICDFRDYSTRVNQSSKTKLYV